MCVAATLEHKSALKIQIPYYSGATLLPQLKENHIIALMFDFKLDLTVSVQSQVG